MLPLHLNALFFPNSTAWTEIDLEVMRHLKYDVVLFRTENAAAAHRFTKRLKNSSNVTQSVMTKTGTAGPEKL